MQNLLLNYIRENEIVKDYDRLVIGFSGGPDSVFLLDFFLKIKNTYHLELALAYLNHGLRGEDSKKEEEFVFNIAKSKGLKLFYKTVDLKSQKGNLEALGRQERYKLFKESCIEFNTDKIALAHHGDDNVETIIMNLLRGTGLNGVKGILPKTKIIIDGKQFEILRPLMAIFKKAIKDYLEKNDIFFINDKTNQTLDYKRNSIRNELIPLLEEKYNPQIKDALQNFSCIAKEYYDYVDKIVEENFKKCVVFSDEKIILSIDVFKDLEPLVLHELLRKIYCFFKEDGHGFTCAHISEIKKVANSSQGHIIFKLPYDIVIKKQYDNLIFYKFYQEESSLKETQTKIVTQIFEAKDISLTDIKQQLKKDKSVIYCDFDKIKGKLFLSPKYDGDVMMPLGMKDYKKLKDIFIDEKIPYETRELIPVLHDEEKIIWVIGVRMDERVKCDASTKRVLMVKFQK